MSMANTNKKHGVSRQSRYTPSNVKQLNRIKLGIVNVAEYCKNQESLEAYKAAANWSTLAGTYAFVVEE